jgi:hypothetical protein
MKNVKLFIVDRLEKTIEGFDDWWFGGTWILLSIIERDK